MSLHIQLFPEFGSFCANGEKAAAFRFTRIDPLVQAYDRIVLDFQGVRNMNASFANALIANLIAQHPEALDKLQFTHCNTTVRAEVEAALELDMERVNALPAVAA